PQEPRHARSRAPRVPGSRERRARRHPAGDRPRRRRRRPRGHAQPHRQRPRAAEDPPTVVIQPETTEEEAMIRRILGAVALAALLAVPLAHAQTKLKWAHVYEVSEPYHLQAVWAAGEIKKRTNGRLDIEVFPASTLGKETDINQALTLGTVDIIYTGMAFAGRTYPPMSIASGPFIFRDFAHWQAFRTSPVFKELAQAYESKSGGNHIAGYTYYGQRHLTANKLV